MPGRTARRIRSHLENTAHFLPLQEQKENSVVLRSSAAGANPTSAERRQNLSDAALGQHNHAERGLVCPSAEPLLQLIEHFAGGRFDFNQGNHECIGLGSSGMI